MLLFLLIAGLPGGSQSIPTRTIGAPCDQVWPVAAQVFLSKHLLPEAVHPAGGVMLLRWSDSDNAEAGVVNEHARRLTTYGSQKFFDKAPVEHLRLSIALFSVADMGASCEADMKFEYQGWLHTFLNGTGWFVLPTNGVFENDLLELIAQKASLNPDSPKKASEQKAIIVRFTSTPPDAEIQVDGKYLGNTPSEELTSLPAGRHTIVIKKLGYQRWEQRIALATGDDRTISADLELQPRDIVNGRIVRN